MSKVAKYHPDDAMLRRFLDGSLLMGMNVAVSAHVASCDVCQESIARLSDETSADWYENIEQDWNEDFSEILEQIVEKPDLPLEEKTSRPERTMTVTLKDRRVELPMVLAQLAENALAWKEIASGIHQALIDIDPKTKFEFIYMQPGARVPRHSHLGAEIMLVLDGDISDNFGHYGVSDFVFRNLKDEHGQTTENGCICLFVTDAPLLFSEGKARLINPINRLKHWLSS